MMLNVWNRFHRFLYDEQRSISNVRLKRRVRLFLIPLITGPAFTGSMHLSNSVRMSRSTTATSGETQRETSATHIRAPRRRALP